MNAIDRERAAQRLSLRGWSKGSAVRLRQFSHPPIDRCPCGAAMRRCDDCGLHLCDAPGHARHVCPEGGSQ